MSKKTPLLDSEKDVLSNRPYHFPGQIGCYFRYVCCCRLEPLAPEEVSELAQPPWVDMRIFAAAPGGRTVQRR